MKLRVISVGNKCPGWIRQGFDEYAKRMPKEMPLSLTEIAAPKHHQDSSRDREGQLEQKSHRHGLATPPGGSWQSRAVRLSLAVG